MNKQEIQEQILVDTDILNLQYSEDISFIWLDDDKVADVNIDDCNFEFSLQVGSSERNFVNVLCNCYTKLVCVCFYTIEKVCDTDFSHTTSIIKALATKEQIRLNTPITK